MKCEANSFLFSLNFLFGFINIQLEKVLSFCDSFLKKYFKPESIFKIILVNYLAYLSVMYL